MTERTIRYTARASDLLHPEHNETVFAAGMTVADDALCAEFARLAYRRFDQPGPARSDLASALATVGFTDLACFASRDSQAFAASHTEDGRVIVAFRGTKSDDIRDAITDARFLPTSWPAGGKVHGGFALAATQLLDAGLRAWLRERSDRPRVYTGHSLGAALATLVATVERPTRLVTFGSPLVGNPAFGSTLTGLDIARYVDCCDIVCRLPPAVVGYRHVGTLHYVDRLGRLSGLGVDDDIERDQDSGRLDYRGIVRIGSGDVPLRDLADHAPANYVYALFAIPG